MSFHGPQVEHAKRIAKQRRRVEADTRNALTKPERRRKYRLAHVKEGT